MDTDHTPREKFPRPQRSLRWVAQGSAGVTRLVKRYDVLVVRQFVKFCIVGILNTALTLGVIFVLMRGFAVNYVLANMIGYVLGLVNSFLWNKTWTFRSTGSLGRESVAFLAVFGVSYAIQLGALVLLKETCNLHVEVAQVVSMVIFSAVNFLGNKFFSFVPVDRKLP